MYNRCGTKLMPHKSSGSGIYCIKNLVNGKVYIGQAAHLERRLYEHRLYLSQGKDKSAALQRAINKYGIDSFDMSILEYCSIDDLNDREIFYIDKFHSNNRNHGYNIASGGGSGLIGYIWPKSFGEKISKAKKGFVKVSDETRRKLSLALKGKPKPKGFGKKISLANQGENHPMYGRKHTPESIDKMKEKRGAEKSYQFGTKKDGARSKFFGVYRVPRKGHIYWSTYIKVHGERIYIGASKDEVEAAKMYDKYVIEHGLPNPLNFPEG